MTTNPIATAEALESGIADQLMKTAHLLVEVQANTQPAELAAIRHALAEGAEWECQLTFGPLPRIRIVTLDHDGEELVLIRRIDLASLKFEPSH